jgi:hypothetical protein
MRLNETNTKIRTDEHLSGLFPAYSALKYGNVSLPLLSNLTLEEAYCTEARKETGRNCNEWSTSASGENWC